VVGDKDMILKNKIGKIILNCLGIAAFVLIVFFAGSYAEQSILKNNMDEKIRAVLGEESLSGVSGKFYSSEDYQITQLAIKGEGGIESSSENETTALEITDVRSEVYSLKDKDETKALVSWKTNKSATSEMAYEKKAEKTEKKIKDNGYSLNHSAIIENLSADSIYGFKIKNIDKWGNEKESEEYVFYTGAPNVSLVDVLESATTKLFGWAIKK
jgi:hypothetical protein